MIKQRKLKNRKIFILELNNRNYGRIRFEVKFYTRGFSYNIEKNFKRFIYEKIDKKIRNFKVPIVIIRKKYTHYFNVFKNNEMLD